MPWAFVHRLFTLGKQGTGSPSKKSFWKVRRAHKEEHVDAKWRKWELGKTLQIRDAQRQVLETLRDLVQ